MRTKYLDLSLSPFRVIFLRPLQSVLQLLLRATPLGRIYRTPRHLPGAMVSSTAAQMAPRKKIAIMTSGGDSPGMNGVVRACVRMAIHMGCDAFCVFEGY